MSLAPGWRRLFRLPRFSRKAIERDVDDELAFHLSMREETLRRLGHSSESAQANAIALFGDPERVREECLTIDQRYVREVRFMEWLESVLFDVRYAFRTLRRMPGFTIVATLTLALGIGATAAMFTLVNAILLRPLPYPDADRLVRVLQAYPEKGLDSWGVSQENIVMYRDRASDFAAFSAYRGGSITMTGSGAPMRVAAARVTGDFFVVMGVSPMVGRAFGRDEDAPGRNDVAVLSNGFWQTRFAGDRSVIGTTIDLDGRPTRIIGVMPPDFAFPRADIKLWLPMGLDPTRKFGWINSGVARLRPGVSIEHARRQTTAIMWDWMRRRADLAGASVEPSKTQMHTIVTPLRDAMTGRVGHPLTVLLGAVSLLLLIATANVATLLSSRAVARQREIGLRTALGATSRRVLRQLLTESLALAFLGALAGIALAFGAVRAFTHSSLVSLPRIEEVTVDGRVLAFTLAVSVVSGALFGLLPALHGVRSRLAADLTAGTRESAHRATRRINDGLVVAQLSLSVVLLIAAGLLLESVERLTRVDLGFQPDGVSVVSLAVPASRVASAPAASAFYNSLLQDVRALPGIRTASLSWSMPFEGNSNVDGYVIDGRPVPPSGNEDQTMQTAVSPGFFATAGITLLEGRDFTITDDSAHALVVVVNDVIANRYWRPGEALGKRIRVTGDQQWSTIVGVVRSARDMDAASPPGPHIYASLAQLGGDRLTLAVRTTGDAAAVIRGVRAVIARIEPSIPLEGARPLASFVEQSRASRRLTEVLLAGFAALAVVLAGVGIFGVMSLSVANRSREFGVRLAVGAAPGTLVRHVLREGALLAAMGVGSGVLLALVATRWIANLLYAVSPTDPVIFAVLSLMLGAIAVAACWLPARRAARSDPLVVLRAD